MRAGRICPYIVVSVTAGLLALGQVNLYAWEPNASDLEAALSSGDVGAYLGNVTAWLNQRTPAESDRISGEALEALLQDPVFRNTLDQRQFLSAHGVDSIKPFAQRDQDNRTFLAWLLRYTGAMDLYLEGVVPTGLAAREQNRYTLPVAALGIWQRIFTADPDSRLGLELALAIATAVAPPGSGNRGAGQREPFAEPRVLIPMATDQPAVWRYTTTAAPKDWNQPSFNDTTWPEGKAGFGVADHVTPQSVIGTAWKTADIWLRKAIEAPSPLQFETAALTVRHDEDVEIYVGGKLVFAAPGFNTVPTAYDVTKGLREALKPGKNLVAVHVHQTTGGQYIDLGLVLDPKEKPAVQADPNDFLLVERLRASRWPPEKAWKWYGEVSPISGCNYLPRTAVNTTEMWQAESFDLKTIDQELGWAEKIGMNSIRVFVQYIVYEADPEGLVKRMDEFLRIADKHGIRTMVILFDDCFLPEPKLGKQPDPVLGVHNSQWTSSPGQTRKRRENWPALEKYVKGVVGHFAQDRRVLAWDLYNEAAPASRPLVAAAFAWARAAEPAQPLTSCWQAEDLSDVLTFHDYGAPNPEALGRQVAERPALCTECIARGAGSRFDNVLPAFAEKGIGWYMWGLVRGRTQTYYPWGSPKGAPEPEPWHHDLLHADGAPYRPAEIEAIHQFPKQFKPRK